jgi:2-C-methyl-D-erythritol 2,4-cyclodiphosphate synthase
MKLLAEVCGKVREAGYEVVNVDATVVAEAPKLTPYKRAMAETIARALCVGEGAVNVKATTEEGLGLTGTGRAISASAVCLLSCGG